MPLFFSVYMSVFLTGMETPVVIEMFAWNHTKLLCQLGYLLAIGPKTIGSYSVSNLSLKYLSMNSNV